jgi:hypothetical protein
VLYWTTLSFGRTIESLSIFSQLGAAGSFRLALERTIELDGACFHGGPHRALALYLAQAPGVVGGDSALARRHAEEAVRIAPTFAENHLGFAEVLMHAGEDAGAATRDALRRALDLPDEIPPDAMPEQRIAKARARVLLKGATRK